MSLLEDRFFDNLLSMNLGKCMASDIGVSERSIRNFYKVNFSNKKTHKYIYRHFFQWFDQFNRQETLEDKFIYELYSSLKNIPSLKRMIGIHLPKKNKRIKSLSLEYIYKKIALFLSKYFDLLRGHGYLSNIIITDENKYYVYQVIGVLLFEASMDICSTSEFVKSIEDYSTPMEMLLKDNKVELLPGNILDLIDCIVISKKYDESKYTDEEIQFYKRDAQRKEFERLKKESYYEKNPNGSKFFDFIENVRFHYKFQPYPFFVLCIVPFILTKFIISQKVHSGNKKYKQIMSDFNDAISFLKSYKVEE